MPRKLQKRILSKVNIKNNIKNMVPVLLVMAALFACDKKPEAPAAGQPPQAQKTAQPQQQPQKAVPAQDAAVAVAEAKKPEDDTYIYDPKGRRDPFLSIIEAAKKEKEAGKKKKGARPVEAFDINEFRLLAIAKDKNIYYAMIQLPDKKYLTIKEGATLGLYGGKVISIREESLVVREYIKNYKGEVEPKDTILRLRKEEGE